ncbi:glycosyltransferase family A protein [Opitutales bacterium ASA1]|uniref:glycosyltransferase family 2 protein n=1 Tax=Congregicoccus parvus TaxID=3081749 RepID=UPI002B2E17FE|nr:glycosyltransferase family A protein [Opitutales bacterium ASA1]
MRISVVIPTKDSATTIAAQLEAVAAQTCRAPWEVIVADNGSRDGTRTIVAAFHERLPDVRLVEAANRAGAAHARNQGVAEARGERIAFCDSDDVVAPGWLEAIDKALDTHEIVGGPLVSREINEPWLLRTRPWLENLERGVAPDAFLPWVASANLGVRRELHERIAGFDEHLRAQEDQDYCWRAQLAGATLGFASDAKVHYRLRTDLKGIYRQALTYGEYYPALFRKFAPHGLRTVPVSAATWLRLWGLPALLLRDLPRALGKRESMATWALRLGLRVGSLRGTVRFRHPLLL